MFYVTGQSLLSTFADYKRYHDNPTMTANQPTSSTSTSASSTTALVTSRASEDAQSRQFATNIHKENEKIQRSLALYPFILMAAIILTFLSYFYTLLLTPALLKATNEALVNGFVFGNDSNGNRTKGPATTLPLMIDCPPLTPRQPARKISDLRADDIKVILGIGDSVMAGFGANGVQSDQYISINTVREARGVSFAMGGDHGRVTIPNLIHYYSHDLYGSSVGNQVITICFGDQFCPIGQYKKDVDVLNGAQSGARSLNMNHELDYLLSRLDEAYKDNRIQRSDWKLLTLFIGSNDICHACAVNSSLPEPYTINVQQAVERIRLTIPNVLVQIIGMIRVDEIFTATQAYPEYCKPFSQSDFVLHDHECMCAHSAANRTIMAQLVPRYNNALQQIAAFYRSPMYTNDSFAVVYHPLPVNILSFPIQAISDVDCFHPSALAHQWFAKELWRMMYSSSDQVTQEMNFQVDESIFCPNDTDRIQIR